MGLKLQTKSPVLPKLLKPATPDHTSIAKKETLMKAKQCENYNQRQAARNQSPLKIGDSVWIRDMKRSGEVISASDYPRSFIINNPQGIIRRNRCAIIATPLAKDQVPASRPSTVPPAGMTTPGLQWEIILLLLLMFNKPDGKTQAHQLPGQDCILLRIRQTQFKEILFGKPDRKTQTHQLLGPVYILLYLRRL